eukprot:TRINITY_DN5986_c0_g1_i2.p1 TRINITY_DN5986_c0_g1~~TRINITY_DN5986_c0_g1_i2.p1  ORF type:complete len:249 (+),score=45.10 TRINITY_DN5986_c0_g1_i2:47-793(+)
MSGLKHRLLVKKEGETTEEWNDWNEDDDDEKENEVFFSITEDSLKDSEKILSENGMGLKTRSHLGDNGPSTPPSDSRVRDSQSRASRTEYLTPEIQYSGHIVAPPTEYNTFLDLRTASFSVKLLCVLHCFLLLYWFFLPTFWWMIFFGVFTVLGFFGAHYYKAKWLFLFMIYLGLNLLLLIVFIYVELGKEDVTSSIIIFGFLLLIGEVYIIHYTYQFAKKLPADMRTTFSQFFSSGSGLEGLPDDVV